ncbi:dephospho-CoA kinase [Helicobacter heilmannii]|uniref:Dephospho-CoA kinase n=1 Tax=Helicobacter heilmannii TaxID=35817 RepID=A0A0K2XJ81_HELHE|nr:dephospho-CoA kinase [Helicobacter heilmannii]BDQ27267.1 dephospho-CoA kinase [Helicobacter heilmannii]CCM12205.1 Dephospho-CoA kinase [Helicobacter heilmannii ASB1.4]CRF46558.1 Dephospho-CoA kinase [Helicobacter heilmannii]CRI34168.1 Dephospho-CoA kinase [Helicobacter heilmannii]
MSLKHAFVLTGGIGTGKSTAASLLALHGHTIIDADKSAHALLEKHAKELIEIFGEGISQGGQVSRPKLGALVFSDPTQRAKLEAFLHPKIRLDLLQQAHNLETSQKPYFLDIPLYFEIEGQKTYGVAQIVLVYAPKETQIQRVAKRDKLSHEQILKRLDAQMDIETKRALSPYILDNSKDLKHLQIQVEAFLNNL